ncbi:MAG: hypothetical protein ABIH34_03845 [Nanoarchaeota archaeon]
MAECQESGCVRAATKDWNGRKVCDDHWDHFRDQQDAMYDDLDYR